jgi:hypothetical protein
MISTHLYSHGMHVRQDKVHVQLVKIMHDRPERAATDREETNGGIVTTYK